MAERGYNWSAPPPLPSYENAWNGADQPPSYEEALMGAAGPQHLQAPTVAAAVYPNSGSAAGAVVYPNSGSAAGAVVYPNSAGAAGGVVYPNSAGAAGAAGVVYPNSAGAAGAVVYPNSAGAAGAVYPNPAYPPPPHYPLQAGGASSAWPHNTLAQNGQRVMVPAAASAAYPNPSTNPAFPPQPNPAYPPLPNYQPSGVPPAWPQNTVAQDSQRATSNDELLAWWRNVEPWERMSHSSDKDPRELAGQVQRVQTALQVYGVLMRTHGEVLQKHVGELLRASNDVSKSCEVRRAAGVTGGSTKAVGSAAAVAGIVLAPVTMGLSLAITAVGVGVLAAGGVAKSKIKSQAVLSHDRRALETNVQDCRKKMADIEACLRFIHTGMDHIMQQRNLSKVLKGADMDPARVSKMLDLSGAVARGAAAAGGSSDLLRGFAGGLGKYYSKKNSQLLKKSKVDKFGKSLYKVSQRLQSTLNDLRKTADSLSRF